MAKTEMKGDVSQFGPNRQLRKIEIELTSECIVGRHSKGGACVHCSLKAGTGIANYLTLKETESMLADASRLGAKTVVLTGGEPAQHPDFVKILKTAKKMQFGTRVYTTGVIGAWQRTTIDQMASLIDEVFLSVEGIGEIHDRVLAWPGAFDQMVEFARKMNAAGIKWAAHFTPMTLNYRQVDSVARTVHDLGAASFKLIDFVPQGRGWTNRTTLELGQEQYFELFSLVQSLRGKMVDDQGQDFVKFHDETYIQTDSGSNQFGAVQDGGCTSGRESCAILSDGSVIPCLGFRLDTDSNFPSVKHIAGNIRNNSFENIWMYSKVMKQFAHSRSTDVNSMCKGCSMVNDCLGCCSCRRTELEQEFLKRNKT